MRGKLLTSFDNHSQQRTMFMTRIYAGERDKVIDINGEYELLALNPVKKPLSHAIRNKETNEIITKNGMFTKKQAIKWFKTIQEVR